jgi:hypothetical protein
VRAFTPDDEKALRAASRTFPKTDYYDVQQSLTSMGIGEAMVVTLTPKGTPTPPFVSRMIPPQSRMGPLTEAELAQRLRTPQVKKYATMVDRESAHEILQARFAAAAAEASEAPPAAPPRGRSAANATDDSVLGQVLNSSVGRSVLRTAAVAVTGTLVRGIMGALMGGKKTTRRR